METPSGNKPGKKRKHPISVHLEAVGAASLQGDLTIAAGRKRLLVDANPYSPSENARSARNPFQSKNPSHAITALILAFFGTPALALLNIILNRFVSRFWWDYNFIEEVICQLPWLLPFYIVFVSPIIFLTAWIAIRHGYGRANAHRILSASLFGTLSTGFFLIDFQGSCILLYRIAAVTLSAICVVILRPLRMRLNSSRAESMRSIVVLCTLALATVGSLFILAPRIEYCVTGKCWGAL